MSRAPRSLAAPLVFATGLLVATGAAVALDERGWWVLCGPAVLVLAVFAAAAVATRSGQGLSFRLAWIHAASFVVASLIVALRDPALVPTILPLLGASVAFGFARTTCRAPEIPAS